MYFEYRVPKKNKQTYIRNRIHQFLLIFYQLISFLILISSVIHDISCHILLKKKTISFGFSKFFFYKFHQFCPNNFDNSFNFQFHDFGSGLFRFILLLCSIPCGFFFSYSDFPKSCPCFLGDISCYIRKSCLYFSRYIFPSILNMLDTFLFILLPFFPGFVL